MKYLWMLAGVVCLAGCQVMHATVPMRANYADLPEDAMRLLARDIETAVARGERDPAIAPRNGLNANDELVRQAIRTRAARRELLDDFLRSGFGYEASNGLVVIARSREYSRSTTRRERDRNALVVSSENRDRWLIYEGLVKAGNLPPGTLGAVKQVFYQERVALLQPGQRYEDSEGNLQVK